MPPNTVYPMVLLATAPAPVANTNGNTPSIKAKEVITIGRNRSLIASIVAGIISTPLSTLSLANSTIRMAFFAASPIKVTNPICAYTLFANLGSKVRVRMAPKAPIGTANNTENGTDQLSYNAARNKNTNAMDRLKMITVLFPAFNYSLLKPEHSYP